MRSRVTIRDRGFEKAVNRIVALGDSYVTAGVKSSAMHTDRETGKSTSLAEIAQKNEYGTATSPARSFIRATIDGRQADIAVVQTKVGVAVANGRMSLEQGLGVLGLWLENAIKAKIASNVPPPNAPSTVRQKGSSHTLIDSGQLRQGITHSVHISKERPVVQPVSIAARTPPVAHDAHRRPSRSDRAAHIREQNRQRSRRR